MRLNNTTGPKPKAEAWPELQETEYPENTVTQS